MARRSRIDLMSNSAAGNGTAFDWPGGDGVFFVEAATFGGGSVALQFQGPAGNWVAVASIATGSAISLTVAGMANFRIGAGQVRAVATTASAVYASVVGTPSNIAG